MFYATEFIGYHVDAVSGIQQFFGLNTAKGHAYGFHPCMEITDAPKYIEGTEKVS